MGYGVECRCSGCVAREHRNAAMAKGMAFGTPFEKLIFRMAEPNADSQTPEGKARDTIENLLNGKIGPKTVSDIGHAVDRAKANSAVRRIGAVPQRNGPMRF